MLYPMAVVGVLFFFQDVFCAYDEHNAATYIVLWDTVEGMCDFSFCDALHETKTTSNVQVAICFLEWLFSLPSCANNGWLLPSWCQKLAILYSKKETMVTKVMLNSALYCCASTTSVCQSVALS